MRVIALLNDLLMRRMPGLRRHNAFGLVNHWTTYA
jgi:hypothetical protein